MVNIPLKLSAIRGAGPGARATPEPSVAASVRAAGA